MVPPASFDDALELLQKTQEVVACQELDIKTRDAELEATREELKRVRNELQLMRMGMYGRKSEKLHPNQLNAFDLGEAPATEEQADDEDFEIVRRKKRKKGGNGKGSFPAHLPREDHHLDLPEDERQCECCDSQLRLIGRDVTERGHIVPAQLIINRYLRAKYACPHGHGVKTAPMPENIAEGGKYEPSVYAHLATLKYGDHLPLNRISGIFKRYGVKLPKSTMWDLLKRLDELVAQPVVAQMRKELLKERALHADETPFKFRFDGEKQSKTGYIYTWQSVRVVNEPKVLIEFRTDRSRAGPKSFLGTHRGGVLLIDGYSGYREPTDAGGIQRAGCWAHARRKFENAFKLGIKPAASVLRPIHRLFWIERAILARAKGDPEQGRAPLDTKQLLALRKRVRAQRSARTLEWIHTEAKKLSMLRSTLPKSELGKALTYLRNQREPLKAFMDWPRLPIHNNDAERTLRHCVIGRKNYQLFGSQRGGEVGARLYSLILSCKANDVNPERYLLDVLDRVSTHPHSRISELTPWGWKAEQRDEAGPGALEGTGARTGEITAASVG